MEPSESAIVHRRAGWSRRFLILAAACAAGCLHPAAGPDGAHAQSGPAEGAAAGAPPVVRHDEPVTAAAVREALDAACNWLTDQQIASGAYGFEVPDRGVQGDVGITALVVHALAQSPRGYREEDGPFVSAAVTYLLSAQRPDGGIYEEGDALNNYKTSVAILAFTSLDRGRAEPRYREVVARARDYIAGLQCSEKSRVPYSAAEHKPSYGGIGYGSDRRPDLSNSQFALEALHVAGLAEDSDVYQRALTFLARCQNRKASNDFLDDTNHRSSEDGGFFYAPGESKAGEVAHPDGARTYSSYGSMTYAGIKSYIYAGLTRDDPRVQAAWEWIRKNYTVERNPGMASGKDPARGAMGLYYYYVVMAKTLDALGAEVVESPDGVKHRWADELARELLARRTPRGTWVNTVDRWWEGAEVLTTAYAVEALTICQRHLKE